jgi:hypothetical protein
VVRVDGPVGAEPLTIRLDRAERSHAAVVGGCRLNARVATPRATSVDTLGFLAWFWFHARGLASTRPNAAAVMALWFSSKAVVRKVISGTFRDDLAGHADPSP